MDSRYEKICDLSLDGSSESNAVSVVAGALLYDQVMQSKLVRLKLKNNCPQMLTGVLVKCVLYGENRENVLEEIFYQYEGLHVASGKGFGEQTLIAIQAYEAQSFDVAIVNATFEKQVVSQEDMSRLDVQDLQKMDDAVNVSDNSIHQMAASVNEKSLKKKFSPKWLIAGAVLIGILLFAVLGSGFADPAVGRWKIGDIYTNIQGMELHIKGSGRYTLGMKGEEPIVEGKWERNKVADENSDKETMQYYTYYSEEGYRLGIFAHIDYSDTIALTIDNDDKVLIFENK